MTLLFLVVVFFNFPGTLAFAFENTDAGRKDAAINVSTDKIQ